MGLVPADYKKLDGEKAQEFDNKIMKNFAGAFPAVARQIFQTCGILEGTCIEIGSGTCRLTMELAKQSNLQIFALEIAPAMFVKGQENVKGADLEERIKLIQGDAHKMPFDDNYADLIVSRGSYHYWKDKPAVFKEIFRVLKPGGFAFIGGGFGHGHSDTELKEMTKLRDQSLGSDAHYYYSSEKMQETLQAAGIADYKISMDETGLWAVFTGR